MIIDYGIVKSLDVEVFTYEVQRIPPRAVVTYSSGDKG